MIFTQRCVNFIRLLDNPTRLNQQFCGNLPIRRINAKFLRNLRRGSLLLPSKTGGENYFTVLEPKHDTREIGLKQYEQTTNFLLKG